MVVLVIHFVTVAPIESEGDPPTPIDVQRPLPFSPTLERMEPKSWSIEISNAGRRMKPRQNPSDLRHMVRIQASAITGFEESLQPTVSESDDHSSTATCNGTRVKPSPLVGST